MVLKTLKKLFKRCAGQRRQSSTTSEVNTHEPVNYKTQNKTWYTLASRNCFKLSVFVQSIAVRFTITKSVTCMKTPCNDVFPFILSGHGVWHRSCHELRCCPQRCAWLVQLSVHAIQWRQSFADDIQWRQSSTVGLYTCKQSAASIVGLQPNTCSQCTWSATSRWLWT